MGDLCFRRHVGPQPLDGRRERPGVHGWIAACARRPECHLLWQSVGQPDLHDDGRNHRLADLQPVVQRQPFQPGAAGGDLVGHVRARFGVRPSLLAAMAVQARTRDILLPILLFPVVLPVILAAVKASTGFLDGIPIDEIRPWLNLLIAYDIIFSAVAFMVFDYVVEE